MSEPECCLLAFRSFGLAVDFRLSHLHMHGQLVILERIPQFFQEVRYLPFPDSMRRVGTTIQAAAYLTAGSVTFFRSVISSEIYCLVAANSRVILLQIRALVR